MYQRLEFGPGDEDDAYLDEMMLHVGSKEEPVTGGYQLLRHLEVGPLLVLSEPSPVEEKDYVRIKPYNVALSCVQQEDCQSFHKLIAKYEEANQPK